MKSKSPAANGAGTDSGQKNHSTALPVTATHPWTCRTCRRPIHRGSEIIFAPGTLFRPFHPAYWEKRPRRFRSRSAVMREVLGLRARTNCASWSASTPRGTRGGKRTGADQSVKGGPS